MNTRSLRFQLTAWYAGLVAGIFLALGLLTYIWLERYMEGSLKETQLRRARQIGLSLLAAPQPPLASQVRDGIQLRYAPEANHLFVRVTQAKSGRLYSSKPPLDDSFDPESVAVPPWPTVHESTRRESLSSGQELLVASYVCTRPDSEQYLVEAGASTRSMQEVLHQVLLLLGVGLPIVGVVTVSGGYWLVKRALLPVDQIRESAERISLQNLSQRLPVPPTGDELERLSIALNHMITRLDSAFQHSRRFVADASHELRTPLTILRGELEAMLQDRDLPSNEQETVASLLEETERLANIVEGLFALSRLDAGEAKHQPARFDLAELTTSTAEQMELLAADKKISVECDAKRAVMVDGDRARLKQVIVNLLDNAIKYTPEGGRVCLKVSANDRQALLEVSDNGIGIAPEALPHIFQRFYRVDKARSRECGGAGLGLSIVESITLAHGGLVSVDSVPGQGSRFRVGLPLAA